MVVMPFGLVEPGTAGIDLQNWNRFSVFGVGGRRHRQLDRKSLGRFERIFPLLRIARRRKERRMFRRLFGLDLYDELVRRWLLLLKPRALRGLARLPAFSRKRFIFSDERGVEDFTRLETFRSSQD